MQSNLWNSTNWALCGAQCVRLGFHYHARISSGTSNVYPCHHPLSDILFRGVMIPKDVTSRH